MKRSHTAQLNCLWSPSSIFRDEHFIDTVTDFNSWKFQGARSLGVAMASIQTFFLRWGDWTWPGDMTLCDLGLIFQQYVRKRCMNRCAEIGGAERRRFFRYLQKPEGWSPNTSGTERVKKLSDPGHSRSGHQAPSSDLTSEKVWMLVITTPNGRSTWSLQRLISVTIAIKCLSLNFDVGNPS